jgi:hypothetical protein
LIGSLELVEIDGVVLDRAAQPMSTELGTLDAIHLATAPLWREMMHVDLVMATHDVALGLGAQAHGFVCRRRAVRANSAPLASTRSGAESG